MSRPVAVKTITYSSEEGAPDYMVREISKIAALCLHPNLPNLTSVLISQGESMSASLSLTVGDCSIALDGYVLNYFDRMESYIKCFEHLCQALSHMHKHEFPHGSLNPDAVYVLLPELSFTIGSLSDLPGPPGYLAPEELVHTPSNGYAADVWSLACIMVYFIRRRPVIPAYLTRKDSVMREICEQSHIIFTDIRSLEDLLEENILTSQAIAELKTSPRYIPIKKLYKKPPWSYICIEGMMEGSKFSPAVQDTLHTLSLMLSFLPSQRPPIEAVRSQICSSETPFARRSLKRSDLVSAQCSFRSVPVEFVSELCKELGVPHRINAVSTDLFLSIFPVKRALPTALACLLLTAKCSFESLLNVRDICTYIESVDTSASRIQEKILESESWILMTHSDKMCSLFH